MNTKTGHLNKITNILKNIKLDEVGSNILMEKNIKKKIVTYADCIRDGWVHTDKLFEYLRGKTRSEMFQTANAIDRDMKSKYIETFNHISTSDFIRLRNYMRIYKPGLKMVQITKRIRNSKFSTQALDDIVTGTKNTCMNVINNFIAMSNLPVSITTATVKAAHAMDNITNLTNKCDNVFVEIQKIVSSVSNIFDGTMQNAKFILMWLLKIIAFLNLLRQKQNQDLTSIASLITLILPVQTGELLLSQVTVLPLAVKGIIDYYSGGFKTQVNDESSATIVSAFYYMIRDMVVTLFNGADKLKYNAMKLNQDKVRYFVTAISTTKTLHGYFLELIKMLLAHFQIEIFNGKTHDGIISKESFKKFFDEYYEIRRKDIHESARVCASHASRIDKLYKFGLDLNQALSKALLDEDSKDLRPLSAPLRTILLDLDEMIKLIPKHVLSGEETRRNKPYWLYIFGEPRIGKSAFFQPLLVNELVTRLNLTPDYQNLSTYTYFRRCGNEFWDGYNNQLVTWYNDVFQMNSRAEEVIQTISELTDVVDDNPCIVNMAHVDLKDRIFFDSKLVVSNAQNDLPQQQFLANNCWSGGRHILARRNCVVEFCLTQNYSQAGTIGIDREKLKMAMDDEFIEKISCNGIQLIPIDMYYLRFRHVMTGATLKTVDLVTGLNLIVSDMIHYMSSQDDFKNRLYQFFRARYDDRDSTGIVRPLENKTFNLDTTTVASRISVARSQFKTQVDDGYDTPNGVIGNGCTCYLRACLFVHSFPKTSGRLKFESYYAMAGHTCIVDVDEFLEKMIEFCSEGVTDRQNAEKPWYQKLYERVSILIDSAVDNFLNIVRASLPYFAIAIAYVMVILIITVAANTFEGWLNNKRKLRKNSIKSQSFEAKVDFKQARLVRKARAETSEVKQTFKEARLRRRVLKTETYDEQNVCVEQKIKSHFCRLSLYCLDGDQKIIFPQIANMLAIAGNIFVTPKHYYLRYQQLIEIAKEHGYQLQYEFLTQSNTTIHIPLNLVTWFLDSSSKYSQDLAFCRISRGTAFKDLTRFFLRESESVNLTGCYLYGLRSPIINGVNTIATPTMLPVNQTTLEDVEYDTGEAPCVFENTVLKNIEFVGVMNYIYSNNHTVKGDCGMVLMHSDSSKNCRKILGMHVAGSPNTGEGVSAPLFAEDIEEAIAYFNNIERVITTECYEHMTYDYDNTKCSENMLTAGLQIVGTLKDVIIQGKLVKGCVNLPRTTNIVKSVVFDAMEKDYGYSTLMPAMLKPFKSGDDVISPLVVAFKKYETHPRYIEEDDFNDIKESIVDTFETAKTYNMINRRVLTDFEALNGFGNLKQMDMSTSAGYPYCNYSHSGKSIWFDRQVQENGSSIYTMKEYLHKKVQHRIDLARKGTCMETYYIDTLKDETRPINKVLLGKTRVFQIGPVDLTIVMRKYFGSFIDFCHSSYIRNEIAVGCNPNSIEWDLKLRKFQRVGTKGWDGDFENYDASLWSQIVDMVGDIINEWYHGNSEDNLIRKVLMKTLVFSHHIVENLVFLLYGGNPSGNVLTTILNCMVFMIMIRLFYKQNVKKDLSNFTNDVAVWTFGDDNLTIFNKRIIKTMEDARLFFLQYNMKYTSADKSTIVNEMIHIDDMSFLKRKWVQVDNEIMAPIDKKVILEIPRWSEGDPKNMDNQLQRFNASLLEISNYGRLEFQKMRATFIKMIKQLNETGLFIPLNRLFTYERCYDIKRPSLTKLPSLIDNDRDVEKVTAFLTHALSIGENDCL